MWNFLRQINGFSLFSEDELKDLKPLRKSATTPRICILGGGFGGLYTALYLRRFHWLNSSNCQITLVDQKNHEPSQKSLGGLATKTQANDRETVSARSPRLTLAFWAMSFPKVGINFFPPTRSVRYSQKETPNLRQVFLRLAKVSRHLRPLSLRVLPLIFRLVTNSRMSCSRFVVVQWKLWPI